MGYSKHELGTINMLYYLKKIHTTSLPPHAKTATSSQRPLFSVPKVVIVERFDCTIKIGHDTIHTALRVCLQGERVTLVLGLS